MSTTLKAASGLDVYTIVTNHIINQLENGIIPWHASWYEQGQPQNFVTSHFYTGLNTWLLACLGYKRNLFLTWKQIRNQGVSVKRGEKGHMVVYWLPGTAEKRLRYYFVFNVEQTTIPPEKIPPVPTVSDSLKTCMGIVNSMPRVPAIEESSSSLFYDTRTDVIQMPQPEYFQDNEMYYSALFYALIHSTAHPRRLDRPDCMDIKPLAPKEFNQSELIWEMGSSHLCSMARIPSTYLRDYSCETEGWLRTFHTDKKMIVHAAAYAEQATQYILNTTSGDVADEEIMELP